jgi:hypothetical protein
VKFASATGIVSAPFAAARFPRHVVVPDGSHLLWVDGAPNANTIYWASSDGSAGGKVTEGWTNISMLTADLTDAYFVTEDSDATNGASIVWTVPTTGGIPPTMACWMDRLSAMADYGGKLAFATRTGTIYGF